MSEQFDEAMVERLASTALRTWYNANQPIGPSAWAQIIKAVLAELSKTHAVTPAAKAFPKLCPTCGALSTIVCYLPDCKVLHCFECGWHDTEALSPAKEAPPMSEVRDIAADTMGYEPTPERDKAEGITHYCRACLASFEPTGEIYPDTRAHKYRCTGCGQICRLGHEAGYLARLQRAGYTMGPKTLTPANAVETVGNTLTVAIDSLESTEHLAYEFIPEWAPKRREIANEAVVAAKKTYDNLLARTETAEARVAALEAALKRACEILATATDCPDPANTECLIQGSPSLEDCTVCWRSWLEQQGKEAAKQKEDASQ